MSAPLTAPVPLLPARPRVDAPTLARRLGVSVAAVELTRACELVDLHLDTFIPPRLWGYGVLDRHRGGPLGHRFFGHVDLPRLHDGGLGAGMWSITTNPFRSAPARWAQLQRNLKAMLALVQQSRGALEVCRTAAELRAARARGAHGVLLAIQGGNALEAAPRGAHDLPDQLITRVTLVHLTNSAYGATSSPHHLLRRDKGLSPSGARLIEQLDQMRVFVDLAHIHPKGFWDAVAVHDKRLPLIATHTGVCGVRPHWRNLDDAQLRAIADSGGVAGVIFSTAFLQRRGGPADAGMVIEHLEHILRVGGEGAAALGSDFDGAIIPPADLPGADAYPVLVQKMLDARWTEDRVRRVLGGNALRTFEALRP
jgi:membrane dipeptidase